MQKIIGCCFYSLLASFLVSCGDVNPLNSQNTGTSTVREKAYFSVSPTPAVYRFAKLPNGTYFYTGSEAEAEAILQRRPDFRYEGIAFAQDNSSGGQPIFRFANLLNGNGSYFYTGSTVERDIVIRDYPHMRFEGSTFAVAPPQDALAKPVYRLANLNTGAYLFTQSPEERDYAESLGMWRSEGSTFRANAIANTAPAASAKAYSGYFSADWGTPAPASIDQKIGRHTCLTPPVGDPIQSAPIGPFVRYSGDCLLSYTVSPERFAELKQGQTRAAIINTTSEIAKAASNSFHDHFDWIFVIFDYAGTTPPGANPYGTYYSSSSRKEGRPRRFMGSMMLPFLDAFDRGPVLHEIHHEWSNDGALPTVLDKHWGASSVGGQLGGYDKASLFSYGNNIYFANKPTSRAWCPQITAVERAQALLDRRFTAFYLNANGGNVIPYAPLEMFMMGLASDNEVAPIQVALNPVYSTTVAGEFSATGFEEYPIASIRENIQNAGGIQPNYANAQRDFKGLIVVVTDQTKLPGDTVRKVSEQASMFSTPNNINTETHPDCTTRRYYTAYNFWMATGGRANLMFGGISASVRDAATPQLAN
jgi:hypothetical protein